MSCISPSLLVHKSLKRYIFIPGFISALLFFPVHDIKPKSWISFVKYASLEIHAQEILYCYKKDFR